MLVACAISKLKHGKLDIYYEISRRDSIDKIKKFGTDIFIIG